MSSCSSHFSASSTQSVGFGVELRWPYCVIVYTSSRVPNGFTHSCVNICLTIFTWWLHTAVISSQTSSHYGFFGKHIFLGPVAFKLGRVLLANLVQYNQYYIWNGLIYPVIITPACLVCKQVPWYFLPLEQNLHSVHTSNFTEAMNMINCPDI